MGFLAPIFKEPKDNKTLFDLLEIESRRDLPLFFVFTKVGKYLWKQNIKINDYDISSALQQLKEIFYKIDETAQKVNYENDKDLTYVHEKFAEILQKE